MAGVFIELKDWKLYYFANLSSDIMNLGGFPIAPQTPFGRKRFLFGAKQQ